MYAKLFSRITESSLMEEPMNVRYTFVLMLAICDCTGHVIGTDVAIARRLNMPLVEFTACISELMKPDPHSNSKEEDGRRVVQSEGERGYKLVNYLTYRDMKTEETRREYMRSYMQKYRGSKLSVNKRKQPLASVRHAEAEAETEEKAPNTGPEELFSAPKAEPRPSPHMLRLNAIFRRKDTTRWSDSEMKALRRISPIPEDELEAVEKFYRAKIPKAEDFRRHEMATLLNNWNGEVDKARNFKQPTCF